MRQTRDAVRQTPDARRQWHQRQRRAFAAIAHSPRSQSTRRRCTPAAERRRQAAGQRHRQRLLLVEQAHWRRWGVDRPPTQRLPGRHRWRTRPGCSTEAPMRNRRRSSPVQAAAGTAVQQRLHHRRRQRLRQPAWDTRAGWRWVGPPVSAHGLSGAGAGAGATLAPAHPRAPSTATGRDGAGTPWTYPDLTDTLGQDFHFAAEVDSAVAGMAALALSCSSFSKLMGDFCPMPLCLRRGLSARARGVRPGSRSRVCRRHGRLLAS